MINNLLYKKAIILFLTFCFIACLNAQQITSIPHFEQGKIYQINADVQNSMVQQAMGQSIDFKVNAVAAHSYKITNSTDDFTTLHHKMQRIFFQFDGMGTKRSFDSDNKKDMDGFAGPAIRELLERKYDMITDAGGKITLVNPASFPALPQDDRTAIIFSMLRDITDLAGPPAKGSNSFFKIFPDTAVQAGSKWTETNQTATGKSATLYTLAAITDSTLVVDFVTEATDNITSQIMGQQAVSKINSTSKGQVIIDKASGIVKERNSTTESHGTVEAMNTSMPVTGKTITSIKVSMAE
ncbi:MAG TPA: DUF6263 family protein [Chitinophagaceae bacterium]|nr:DUF6263 family protein [Chitinophagaceae bacterium]